MKLIYIIVAIFITINIHATQELPLVIVTCSYNNAPWVYKNLDSVFMQKYDNFRIIYVDDYSQDGTAQLVEQYIQDHKLQDKITLIKNNVRRMKGENIYKVFHSCDDHEIIIVLDGDDWFAHENALNNINKAYQETGAWFAYSQVEYYPQGTIGEGKALPYHVMQERSFRKYPWVYKSPRSFYAWLYKLVKLEDQLTRQVPLFEGKFFPNCNDRAMVYPMLEMAKDRIVFVPEVAMIQNCYNPFSSQNIESKQQGPTPTQQQCWTETVKSPIKYNHMPKPIYNRLNQYQYAHADCIALLQYPKNATRLFQMIQKYIKNLDTIIFVTNQPEQLSFLPITVVSPKDLSIATLCTNNHILLMDDSVAFSTTIDCTEAINELERTFAYAWYCTLSQEQCSYNHVPVQHIDNGIYAWKFFCDKTHALSIHNFKATIYRKKDVVAAFEKPCSTITKLKEVWSKEKVPNNKIGLFQEQ